MSHALVAVKLPTDRAAPQNLLDDYAIEFDFRWRGTVGDTVGAKRARLRRQAAA